MITPLLKAALIIASSVAAIAAMLGYLIWAETELGDVELGVNGWFALILGSVTTLALGLGLMRLVYLSNRRGYDERAAKYEEVPDSRIEPDR